MKNSKLQSLALTAIPALVWAAMLCLVWLRYPDNHGSGPGMFAMMFASALLVCLGVQRARGVRGTAAIALSVLGLAACWIMDRRNIMVDYLEWADRGMPAWGESP